MRNKKRLGPEDWTPACQAALDELKAAFAKEGLLKNYPVSMHHPDAGPFEVHTDFSGIGMAGVLYQQQRDETGEFRLRFIDAAGRKTQAYEKNYHSSKGELAALAFALAKWEHLLKQSRFVAVTDSSTVQHWATMQDPGGVVRRWLQRFTMFNFDVIHRAGTDLVDADFLSRQPGLPEATPSEQEETREWEPTFPLPGPLAHLQQFVGVPGEPDGAAVKAVQEGERAEMGRADTALLLQAQREDDVCRAAINNFVKPRAAGQPVRRPHPDARPELHLLYRQRSSLSLCPWESSG